MLDSKLPVLVDFWGEHCGPCKKIAPLLDQLAGEMAAIANIGKVDVGSQMPIAVRYGVKALPTFLFFQNGEVKDQIVGANVTKEKLRAKLEELML